MMTLIIGGSGSGKSAFAEDYIMKEAGSRQKYYIATMQIFDEEGERKAKRHQKLRSGKGFQTIEQPREVLLAAKGSAALLECISNLTANEMFSEEKKRDRETVIRKITEDIRCLKERLSVLVVVSNNVFEDGICYAKDTMDYLEAMGRINRELAKLADTVIEVVAGIPLTLKGGEELAEGNKG